MMYARTLPVPEKQPLLRDFFTRMISNFKYKWPRDHLSANFLHRCGLEDFAISYLYMYANLFIEITSKKQNHTFMFELVSKMIIVKM